MQNVNCIGEKTENSTEDMEGQRVSCCLNYMTKPKTVLGSDICTWFYIISKNALRAAVNVKSE